MSSIGPYNPISITYHRTTVQKSQIDLDSLFGRISSNNDFNRFKHIIELAHMQFKLNDPQSNFTIFVPSDIELNKRYSDEYFDQMDTGLANTIIKCSTLNNEIESSILKHPLKYFTTLKQAQRILIRTTDDVSIINEDIKILKFNIICNNGIIHVVDNLILPQYNPMFI